MAVSPQAPARRVLIYRLGSLGDTLIALPALHLIARAFPGAERRMLTSFPPTAKAPPSSVILEHTGLVDGYFRYNTSTRSPRDLLSLWWQLTRWRPDVLIYLTGGRGVRSAKRDALFFRACGIRRLIGVPDTEEMQQNLPEPQLGPGMLEAEAARLTRNLAVLGDAHLDDPASWDMHLTADERARAAQVLEPVAARPLISVSVGTKMQAKDWGRDNWRALLARLAEVYPNYALVLCGAPEESETSEFAAEGWRAGKAGPVVNLCGVLTPRESAAVFGMAKIFIGHDSGPMHLAAAMQTPCVAIFSARKPPGIWFPFGRQHQVLFHQVECENCELETCLIEKKKCILSIEIDEVFDRVVPILAQPLTVLR